MTENDTANLVIVPTGVANIASVIGAFTRLGETPTESLDPGIVERAAAVIVPGVGAFGAAMSRLESADLRSALTERIDAGRPTLAVCVGMQLLCGASEESPGTVGLSVIEDKLTRFGSGQRVPQLGWNRVQAPPDSKFLESGWAYFANSYRLTEAPPGWLASTSDYDGQFVAALERRNVLACQFHPELSGPWGAKLLTRWLDTTRVAT